MPATLETNSLQNPDAQVSGPHVLTGPSAPDTGPTPYNIIDAHLGNLKKEYQGVMGTLKHQYDTGGDYERTASTLQHYKDEYLQKRNSILSVKTQLDTINQLMASGQLDPSSGNQAMWKAVLPEDVASAMFPHTRKEDQFNMVQMRQLAGYRNAKGDQVPGIISDYAKEASVERTWGEFGKDLIPFTPSHRSQADLIPQYQGAKEEAEANLGVPMTNLQQEQFDNAWDNEMKQHANYQWDPSSAEIQAIRAKGKLAQAGGKNITPFGKHVLMYNNSQVTEEKPQIAVNGQNTTGTPVSGPPPLKPVNYPDAVWNEQHKMWTVVREGRLKGVR
jgi:hypothetical protein